MSAAIEIGAGVLLACFGVFIAVDGNARRARRAVEANFELTARMNLPLAGRYVRETAARGFGTPHGDWQLDFPEWGAEWVMRDERWNRYARRWRWFAAAWFTVLGSCIIAAGIIGALH